MRQSKLRHRKHLDDVTPERALDVIQVDFREILLHHLLARVVHEDINSAELVNVLLDDLVDLLEVLEIEGNGQRLSPFFLDGGDGVICVGLFLWKVDYRDVCTLSREQDGYGTSNARAGGMLENST